LWLSSTEQSIVSSIKPFSDASQAYKIAVALCVSFDICWLPAL